MAIFDNLFLFIARRAYRQATTSKNIRVFAVMVADCWSIVATENLESKSNGSRQRRKQPWKEKTIRPNTESKKEREQLQRSADVNLLKIQCWTVFRTFYSGFVVCGLLACNKILKTQRLHSITNHIKKSQANHAKLVKNPSKIHRKTIQNPWNCANQKD